MTTDEWTTERRKRPRVDLPGYLTAPTPTSHPEPLARYRRWVVICDATLVVLATTIGYLARFGLPHSVPEAFAPYRALGIGLVALWLVALYLRGCYDPRFLGVGPDEYNRLVVGTVLVFAIVAGIGYFVNSDVSRGYVFISLPIGLLFLVVGRWTVRRFLYRARRRGESCYRTIVLGSDERVGELAQVFLRDAFAGYVVVGSHEPPLADSPEALAAWLTRVDALVHELDAGAVAVTPSERLDTEAVRRLGWQLEGRGIDLLVAPALGDVAGPRISIRPASGLPLLHLEEPGLSSAQLLAKRTLDLVGAALGLVVLSPALLVIAVLIRFTSPGPVIFRQWRVGQHGQTFRILKFRTMREDADQHRDRLRSEAGHDAPAFKPADDPRVTRVGAVLRRWSIDEWPQLVNVLRGDMSLVGPRPHPLDDVARYGDHDYRRLLAKPGMTGLWQVEGRSELDWAESVRLDLYYIENWSLSRDLVLIVRTGRAVLSGRGAS